MSLRGKLLVAALVALLGIGALALAFGRAGGVRGYLADTYPLVSGGGRNAVYSAAEPPSEVYEDIRSRHRPADTVVDPSGYYLRYSDDIVVVTGDSTGSRIYLDDERRGYGAWFPIVGGFWGTYGGGGVRGGGPGAGK